jgi:hypothetical protein
MEWARGKHDGRESWLSMYSITEDIFYSQLSSVALLLQPEPNSFTSYSTRKVLGSPEGGVSLVPKRGCLLTLAHCQFLHHKSVMDWPGQRLGSLSLYAIALQSSPPSHVSTCNGQRSSQLFCVSQSHSCSWSVLFMKLNSCSQRWVLPNVDDITRAP